MIVFGEPEVIELFDGAAVAALAAAAACRARNFGASPAGAVALGCLCGLCGVFLRELALHGAAGAKLALTALPDDALIGAFAAVLTLFFFARFGKELFFWLDAASMGLASSLGALLAFPILGLAGGLAVSLLNGLTPGLVRDVALGDAAALVEKEWYAAAAMLGGTVALCICLAPVFLPDLANARTGEWAALSGAFCVCGVRWIARRKYGGED